jgi:uncharacterized membrane protein
MRKNMPLLHYIFRIACAMCFIGHGIFGVITKPVWCNYFAVFGIGETLAYQLMPVIGIADIVLGLVLLFYPIRIAAAWLIFWGLFTALLRPLSGESFAEFLERAGNYGAPFILIILAAQPGNVFRNWFQKLNIPEGMLSKEQWKFIVVSLQVIGFILLLGHGWLNVIGKPSLLKQYTLLGIESPEKVANIVGAFEIAGAFSLLLWPVRQLVLVLFIWKVISEVYYPAFPLFEWVERGGSYAILLALWIVLKDKEISTWAIAFKNRFSLRTKQQNDLQTNPIT